MSTEITEDHKTKRNKFSQHCRRQLMNESGYLERIVSPDECKFSLSGKLNKQNCQIWESERQNEVHETLHNSSSVIFWSAMFKNEVIVPYFFENENTTGSMHKRMLRYILFLRLIAMHKVPTWWCTYTQCQRNKTIFGREAPRSMDGRGGPISWPSRYPDLIPCKYFLNENSNSLFTTIVEGP